MNQFYELSLCSALFRSIYMSYAFRYCYVLAEGVVYLTGTVMILKLLCTFHFFFDMRRTPMPIPNETEIPVCIQERAKG